MKMKAVIVLLNLMMFASVTLAQDLPPRPDDDRPPPPAGKKQPRRGGSQGKGAQQYSIEQALSDQAQLHTIAFSGLAFMTGDFGSSTFIPPGKVADFFGFQYMRDIDAAGKGHNPKFLDRIAGNVMKILSERQRQLFADAASDQEQLFREIALKRLPVVAAFHRQLEGKYPKGSGGLSRKAVLDDCAGLFALDGKLAWQRAKLFGRVAGSLTAQQRQALGRMKFGDFNSWPEIDREEVRQFRPRGASKLVSVGYMTLASEFFSWYAGSVEADTYFCPERHGTYFGGFYLKDMPAMGQKDYDISTSLTGEAGAGFMEILDSSQRSRMMSLIERQRNTLQEIVRVRRAISTSLRGFLRGDPPAESNLVALGRRYGQLDGELAYEYATTFAHIYKSLSSGQLKQLRSLRSHQAGEEGAAFIYSDRIKMSELPETDYLFK